MTFEKSGPANRPKRDPRYVPGAPEFDGLLWLESQGMLDNESEFQARHWSTGTFTPCTDDPECQCWVSPAHCHRCRRPVSGPGELCPSFNNC
ncbi:hypothetical protein M1247_21920 [Mycobacterium sp. 21AC1]|uniref:hypothetical protein n=1 Tax=[Mycobacterium] appelbergii TaxID=2939269 RepID=UPI002938E5C9|nr:hypothetical protein [Mycobacterium sp. 21AC1]MDV3127599.1 hypothetical protein [Mycobacterium sp. 21AC1]